MTPLDKLITYLGALTVLIPFIAFLFKRNKVWFFNKWFVFYLMNHLAGEIICGALAMYKLRNLETQLVFNVIEGLLLLLLYNYAFKSKTAKIFSKFLIPLYIAGFASIYFLVDFKYFLPSYTYAFHEVVMLIVVMMYFIERMALMDDIDIVQNPMFYISCGFMLFYGVSIFYFAMHDYLFHHFPEIEKEGRWVHSGMLAIMNVLLAKGIWKTQKV